MHLPIADLLAAPAAGLGVPRTLIVKRSRCASTPIPARNRVVPARRDRDQRERAEQAEVLQEVDGLGHGPRLGRGPETVKHQGRGDREQEQDDGRPDVRTQAQHAARCAAAEFDRRRAAGQEAAPRPSAAAEAWPAVAENASQLADAAVERTAARSRSRANSSTSDTRKSRCRSRHRALSVRV